MLEKEDEQLFLRLDYITDTLNTISKHTHATHMLHTATKGHCKANYTHGIVSYKYPSQVTKMLDFSPIKVLITIAFR